ncbi:hypothetical protein [Vibrio cyclitrophicus]|uniref:hypothetical protein n=1 Tax=Vibrio sp. R78045 TaxID=3093868 RepID=UPI003552B921
MFSFLFKFFSILGVLLFTNTIGHDYSVLKHAYEIRQESFGHLFIFLSYLYNSLGLEYYWVHLTYAMIFSFSFALITKNIIFALLIVFLSGEVLNEQLRFFSGTILALVLIRYSSALSMVVYLIHPAATIVAGISAIVNRFFINKSAMSLFFLVVISIASSFLLKPVIIKLSVVFGYAYAGSHFFESISSFGLLYIIATSLLSIFIVIYSKKIQQQEIEAITIYGLSLSACFFSQFAIFSGRLVLVIAILSTTISIRPSVYRNTINSVRINYLESFSILMLCIVFSVYLAKYFYFL